MTSSILAALVALLAVPIRAVTWRRVVYALVALPAVFVAPRWTARRLLDIDADTDGSMSAGRRIAHAVVSLPLNAVTLLATAYALAGVVLNVAYPIRVENAAYLLAHPLTASDSLDGAWGGPTLAGAWAFHGIVGGVLFGVGGVWLVRGLTWLQGRLLRAMLAPARDRTDG